MDLLDVYAASSAVVAKVRCCAAEAKLAAADIKRIIRCGAILSALSCGIAVTYAAVAALIVSKSTAKNIPRILSALVE